MATAVERSRSEKIRKVQGFLQISEAINRDVGETLGFDVNLTRENGGDEDEDGNYHDLEMALADISSCCSFACGGSVTLSQRDRGCILHMKHPEEEESSSQRIGAINSLRVEDALRYCSTAPYGDLAAQETKVDL
jgi:hypothetical protein